MVNVILGTSKNDKLVGTSNDDAIYGLSGDDTVDGGNGNDVISGGAASSAADADYLGVKQAFKGEVTVDIPKTSSLNPVGMYKIDAAGNISGVTILWGGTIPGLGGLGNQTISKTLAVDLKAGERYGFFILSSGYVSATTATLLNDTKAKWEMRDGDGQSGQITDSNLRLCYVDPLTGLAVPISVGAGHDIYHSVGGAANGYKPNPDGKQHAQTTVDIAQGVVTIGLESGKGNNPDFKDATIKFSMGIDNVLPFGEADPNGNGGNDVLNGGEGDDKVLGMAGNDVLSGGNGQDRLWGNTGNDTLSGDGGDDWLSGGIGNDVIKGGQGQDKLLGQTGNDNLNGEDGDDYVSGDDGDDTMAGGNNNDTLYGGKGNDKLAGDAGDDKLYGDTGNDDISGGDGHDQIKGGDGNDTVSGNNGDDTVSAGKGDDVVQGGAGNDNLHCMHARANFCFSALPASDAASCLKTVVDSSATTAKMASTPNAGRDPAEAIDRFIDVIETYGRGGIARSPLTSLRMSDQADVVHAQASRRPAAGLRTFTHNDAPVHVRTIAAARRAARKSKPGTPPGAAGSQSNTTWPNAKGPTSPESRGTDCGTVSIDGAS